MLFDVWKEFIGMCVRSASARAAPSNKVVSKDRSHEDWDTNPVKQEALSFN